MYVCNSSHVNLIVRGRSIVYVLIYHIDFAGLNIPCSINNTEIIQDSHRWPLSNMQTVSNFSSLAEELWVLEAGWLINRLSSGYLHYRQEKGPPYINYWPVSPYLRIYSTSKKDCCIQFHFTTASAHHENLIHDLRSIYILLQWKTTRHEYHLFTVQTVHIPLQSSIDMHTIAES